MGVRVEVVRLLAGDVRFGFRPSVVAPAPILFAIPGLRLGGLKAGRGLRWIAGATAYGPRPVAPRVLEVAVSPWTGRHLHPRSRSCSRSDGGSNNPHADG